jgi:hypothetical protein
MSQPNRPLPTPATGLRELDPPMGPPLMNTQCRGAPQDSPPTLGQQGEGELGTATTDPAG